MEMTKELFIKQTDEHKKDVLRLIKLATDEMLIIGNQHDHSKYDLIDDYVLMLNGFNFKGIRKGPYQRHAEAEKHHPIKFFHEETNLFDIIEMLADWTSASAQRTGLLDPNSQNLVEVLKLNWDKIIRNTLVFFVNNY